MPEPMPNSGVRLLQGIAKATNQLLTQRRFTTAICQALPLLAEAASVDRIHIAEIKTDASSGSSTVHLSFGWLRETGVYWQDATSDCWGDDPSAAEIHRSPQIYAASAHFLQAIEKWLARQSGNGLTGFSAETVAYQIGALSGCLSTHQSDSQALTSQDHQMVPERAFVGLMVPIPIDDRLWGWLGFEASQIDYGWCDTSKAALTMMAANLGGVLARQQTEAELRRSQAYYKAILDATPDLMFRLDSNGVYLDFAGQDLDLNVPRSAIVGRTLHELLPLELADRCLAAIQAALASGQLQSFEYQLQNLEGELHDYEARLVVSGPGEVLVIVRDITERKQSEMALLNSEARNRALLDAIPDLMFRIHRDGTYLDFHADKESDFVYPVPSMLGKTVWQVLPPEIAEQRMHYVQLVLDSGKSQTYEYQLSRRRENETHDYEARLVASGADEVLAIVRDVTERKRAELQLQASAEHNRVLAEIALKIRQSLDLSQILDTTVTEIRKFLKADRVLIGGVDAQRQGRVLAESVGEGWRSCLDVVVDETEIQQMAASFAQTDVRVIESCDKFPDDRKREEAETFQVQAELAVPIMVEGEFFGVIMAHQCTGPRSWQALEIDLLQQLGTQVAIAIQQAHLYGQVQTLNSNLERQVEERTAELQQRMQELQELNRLKDVFLHTVTHDLRTPVMGSLLVLKNLLKAATPTVETTPPPSQIPVPRKVLERMVEGSERQLAMINSLLEAHSSELRGVTLERELVDLPQFIQSVLEDLEPILQRNQATWQGNFGTDLPLVMLDRAKLRRVYENLITNALKHNPPSIHLVVTAQLMTGSESCCQGHNQSQARSPQICCTIQDNGQGIPEGDRDRLFNLYARGEQSRYSSGIGMGLYFCRQIILAHGGEIGVNSQVGEGATFWFTLPVA